MSDITTAFWGMVINNYDETDLALVRQGYPDFIRKITFTLERGESGTPHIQAYIRLFRQQRLSYVKKLFPGANFKSLTSDEYRLNAENYATKQDGTAESPSVIQNNPFPDPVVELVSVIEEAFKSPDHNEYYWDKPHMWVRAQPEEHILLAWIGAVEYDRVRKTPRLAKFYVGSTYKNVKKEFLHSLKAHVFDLQTSVYTHTHTHADEKLSRGGGITEDANDDEGSQVSEVSGEEEVVIPVWEDDEGDLYSSGSESEAGSESDDSGCSESDAESED